MQTQANNILPPNNEFTRLKTEGWQDLQIIVRKYPVTALVSLFVLSFLGLLHIFSFSVTCVATGLLFGGGAYLLFKEVFTAKFFDYFKFSLGELLLSNKKPETPKLSPPITPPPQ